MLTLDTSLAEFAEFCRMIDEGDDSILPILADLLEDKGDWRAEALREIIKCELSPSKDGEGNYYWELFSVKDKKRIDDGAHLIPLVYNALLQRLGMPYQRNQGFMNDRFGLGCLRIMGSSDHYDAVRMPSKSTAYLILAEVLV